jgi:hypothetical protein
LRLHSSPPAGIPCDSPLAEFSSTVRADVDPPPAVAGQSRPAVVGGAAAAGVGDAPSAAVGDGKAKSCVVN